MLSQKLAAFVAITLVQAQSNNPNHVNTDNLPNFGDEYVKERKAAKRILPKAAAVAQNACIHIVTQRLKGIARMGLTFVQRPPTRTRHPRGALAHIHIHALHATNTTTVESCGIYCGSDCKESGFTGILPEGVEPPVEGHDKDECRGVHVTRGRCVGYANATSDDELAEEQRQVYGTRGQDAGPGGADEEAAPLPIDPFHLCFEVEDILANALSDEDIVLKTTEVTLDDDVRVTTDRLRDDLAELEGGADHWELLKRRRRVCTSLFAPESQHGDFYYERLRDWVKARLPKKSYDLSGPDDGGYKHQGNPHLGHDDL